MSPFFLIQISVVIAIQIIELARPNIEELINVQCAALVQVVFFSKHLH